MSERSTLLISNAITVIRDNKLTPNSMTYTCGFGGLNHIRSTAFTPSLTPIDCLYFTSMCTFQGLSQGYIYTYSYDALVTHIDNTMYHQGTVGFTLDEWDGSSREAVGFPGDFLWSNGSGRYKLKIINNTLINIPIGHGLIYTLTGYIEGTTVHILSPGEAGYFDIGMGNGGIIYMNLDVPSSLLAIVDFGSDIPPDMTIREYPQSIVEFETFTQKVLNDPRTDVPIDVPETLINPPPIQVSLQLCDRFNILNNTGSYASALNSTWDMSTSNAFSHYVREGVDRIFIIMTIGVTYGEANWVQGVTYGGYSFTQACSSSVENISASMWLLDEHYIRIRNDDEIYVSWKHENGAFINRCMGFANISKDSPKISVGFTSSNTHVSGNSIDVQSDSLIIGCVGTSGENGGCGNLNGLHQDTAIILATNLTSIAFDTVAIGANEMTPIFASQNPTNKVLISCALNSSNGDVSRISNGNTIFYVRPYEELKGLNTAQNTLFISRLNSEGTHYDAFMEISHMCLHADTIIDIYGGQTTVGNLKRGDLIRTINGYKPLARLLESMVKTEITMTVFEHGSIDDDIPSEKLLLSRGHPIFYLGEYIVGYELADSYSHSKIHFERLWVDKYYHVQFESHEVIYANGLTVTSLPHNTLYCGKWLPRELYFDMNLYDVESIGKHYPPYTLHNDPPTAHVIM